MIETTQTQQKPPEDLDKDPDSDNPDEENDDESKLDNFEGFNGSGRTVTLQMLMAANVLQPSKAAMTIEYLGQKFVGDLLPDGKIKSHETETIFLSPSAWAMHCKRIINPEKKSGCGWASVKYKGKKLDAYKATWMRKCAQQKDVNQEDDDGYIDLDKKSDPDVPIIKRIILPHNSISNRNILHDANTLVETVPFASINKMQPFLVNISSNALLLADFHSHLTFQEVSGYFGGTWDVNSHAMVIMKAYPCRNTKYDREKAPDIELEIQKQIMKDQLVVVGWYHSHPKFQSEPTLRDCDTQLDYQIKMRGPSDLTYTPCVALIFSPYYDENTSFQSSHTVYWVVPPAENRQIMEYGRPMLMQYDIIGENAICDTVRQEMQSCITYYTKFRNELIDFSAFYRENFTFIEKLKYALYSKFPQKQNDKEFWNWVCRSLKCNENDEFIPPINITKHENKKIERKTDEISLLAECLDADGKPTTPEMKILSLQEQLCLPSGLNMNPSKLCPAVPTPPSASTITTTTVTGAVSAAGNNNNNNNTNNNVIINSPSESPITIPSNSASPAKFEIPIRASPSPVKSDTSSTRTRNSPAPSPGKFNVNDVSLRNSPCVTPNKFEQHINATFTAANQEINNDLMTSSLVASLAGQIPPNFLSNDLSVFFQNSKEYGNTSLKQLAATAAKVGSGGGGNSGSVDSNELFDKRNNSNNDVQFTGSSNIAMPPKLSSMDHSSTKMSTTTTSRSNSDTNSKSNKLQSSSSSSYKTKLMKELDDLKNDPLKISELMRSPEYAALLLQQAEALGATTLGSLGFGNDFSFMGGGGTSGNSKSKNNIPDYNMLQTSKMLGYEAYMQQNKNQSDLNALFQQQMGNPVMPTTTTSTSKKHQKQQKQNDYAALLQTYSKLFDVENSYAATKNSTGLAPHEISAILNAGAASSNMGNTGGKKKDTTSDVINQLLQSDKNASELNNLLMQQSKNAQDLNSLFATSTSNTGGGGGNLSLSSTGKNVTPDISAYYSQLSQDKMQEYANLFQQNHGKFGIPDPLSKTTLAANNMFMTPSTLLKLHQESLNAMMMKPPKSSPGNLSKNKDYSMQDRLTPTKSNRDNTNLSGGSKYNFSAVDLAVSSVPAANNSIGSSSTGGLGPSNTPSIDLTRLYGGTEPAPRKRMEFSSIADLVAPSPAKVSKLNECEDILNLSSNE